MTKSDRISSRDVEHKRRSAQRRARRRTTFIWLLVITVFCILVIAVVHFSPVIIEKFTIVDEYLPRDIERQYWELQDKQRQQPARQFIFLPTVQ